MVIKEATNEGIPYADSFSVECVYCVTKVSETKSRLKVHGGLTFKKYIFGLIKGKHPSFSFFVFVIYFCVFLLKFFIEKSM